MINHTEHNDLSWQKADESDTIQKAERPNAEHMIAQNQCPICHGRLEPNHACYDRDDEDVG